MWRLVAALLLGSLCCGSAQLLFKNIKSVEVRSCDRVVVIPCYASNMVAENIQELRLKWKFGKIFILSFDGNKNQSIKTNKFSSAQTSPSEFLKGNASLTLDKNEAESGNYTCEVTKLSRIGLGGDSPTSKTYKHTVELKYSAASWFSIGESILIIIFPFLTILLFWAQFGILIQKYKSNPLNKKIILLSTSGLLFTIIVIVGAILFIPGNYSKKKSYGLLFLVSPSVILVYLHYHKFKPAIGRTLHAMIILTTVQALGFLLTMAGLYLTITVCVPQYGPLVISGLAIIFLVELFGLVYMKWLDPLIGFL